MDDYFAPCKLVEYANGGYSLILSDANFVHYDVFEELGWEGNGYDWCSVVDWLVHRENPALAEQLSYDPEAGMFVARSDDRDVLRLVAGLVRRAMQDKDVLREAIKNAELD
ncbi:MAG TPA: Imm51 family immunity protein [Roseiflexaceae bacterium]